MDINTLILKNLHYNEEFARKTLPFLKLEYFTQRNEKIIFEEILDFITEYRNIPTYESLIIQLNEKSLSENDYKTSIELLDTLHESKAETVELDWLVNKTEQFCQERAIYNAVVESISILDNTNTTLSKGSIPGLLSDALAVSFDASIGHDYADDSDSRYDYYHRTEDRVPFDLKYFNIITNGGLPKKTLNIILSPPHNGKSLMMCHFASSFLKAGKNVLYITCEMAEEELAKRIDANLMNVSMNEVTTMPKEVFQKKINSIKSKMLGKLKFKEYPTACASVSHFRVLLNELKLKSNFVPDVIFVDYLNICASSRVKMSGSVNSYTYVKAIGEELRGLAQEYNVPLISATQTTRGASTSSDPEMGDVSECIYIGEKITLVDGSVKNIGDVRIGDQITSNDEFKTTMFVHHTKPKDCIRITLKSGKSIIVSKDHIFPTDKGRICYNNGLGIGVNLHAK
jgi:replicative DNA helicase